MNGETLGKDVLRKRMRAMRNALSASERAAADAVICENVCALPHFGQADVVYSYLAMGSEIETRGIIERAWQAGKAVALPRCVGPRQMRWYRVESLEHLEKSPLGVEEPPADPAKELHVPERACAIALVPGYTFDAQGYRLGYGGGFYDTFLADFAGTSIGLCRSVQRVESLADLGAIGPYDLPVDLVVTEGASPVG